MAEGKRGAVPVPTNEFVGREAELDRVLSLLLGSARLITLTGLGGIGKTQLAAEAVGRYHRARSVPVYWVRLARLPKDCGRTEIEHEAARAMAGLGSPSRTAWETILDTLDQRDSTGRPVQSVLVLDNCEHVLDAVGDLVDDVLATVPRATVLATSRAPIGWSDEHLVELPPLSPRAALALFVQRAAALGHQISDAAEIDTAAEVCRHLHHTPLFIRLAAARLTRRPLAVVLDELDGDGGRDRRMSWSYGSAGAREGRHRGIGDAIAWSYDLCSEQEQVLFERMSVFAAGYALGPEDLEFDVGVDAATIAAVCCDDPRPEDAPESGAGTAPDRLRPDDIQDLLDRLVDHSLVAQHRRGRTVRYSLLECLQIFARERLALRGEPAAAARRHLRYYRDRLATAGVTWYGPQEDDVIGWLRSAWPNLLTAIHTALALPGASADGLAVCIALHALPLPTHLSSLREISSYTERLLVADRAQTAQPTEPQLTASALRAADAVRQGLPDDAQRLLTECFAACRVDRPTAEADQGLPPAVEFAWGLQLWLDRRDPGAVTVLARAAGKYLADGEPGFAAHCQVSAAGATASLLASPQQADEIIRNLFDSASAAESQWGMSWARGAAALAAVRHGDGPRALQIVRTALNYPLEIGNQFGMIVLLHAWALALRIAAAPEDTARAELVDWASRIAYMLGGLTALRDALDVGMNALPDFAERTEHAIAVAREVLGDHAFDAAFGQGTRIRLEREAVQMLARGVPGVEPPPPAQNARDDDRAWKTLSKAERQVAILAAAGLTNTIIAARRGTSLRTVEAQLAAILRKLTIESRREIMDFVPERHIADVEAEAARWIGSTGDRNKRIE